MVVGEDTVMTLNPTPNLLERPICSESNRLDNWQSVPPMTSNRMSMAPPAWEDTSMRGNQMGDLSCSGWMQVPDRVTGSPITSQDAHTAVSWKDKHPETWSSDEVTLWICSLMNSPSGCLTPINVAAFLNLTGAELVRMSSADLRIRDLQNGAFVYMSLQALLDQLSFNHLPPISHLPPTSESATFTRMETAANSGHTDCNKMPFRYPGSFMEQEVKDISHHRLTSLDLKLLSIDVNDKFDSIRSLADTTAAIDQLHILRSLGSKGGAMEVHQDFVPWPVDNYPNSQSPNSAATPLASPSSDGSRTPPFSESRLTVNTFDELRNTSQYGFSDVKGNHLWEFIRDLLFDHRYNPSLVKWEDREEGIFKFVKSDQVAKLWGRKKNNPAMTYEKLSRAMRYYYRRKILVRIDGRRLVYKFGPMATGWKA